MQYAFCLEMLYTELPFADRLAAAQKDGIRSIEIWDWRDKDLPGLSAQLSDLNMTIHNMSGNRCFGMIEPYERQDFLNELQETGDVAKRLGCPMLMLLPQPLLQDGRGKPLSTDLSAREKIDQMIACGKEAARIADHLSLDLVIEPLNTVRDHPGFFLNSSHVAFRIISAINHPRVTFLYDIYHMAMMEEDVLRDIRDNLDKIGHLHVADKPGRHEPGSGEIDFSAILSLLQALNYDGTVGFEFTPSRGDSHLSVKKALEVF
ncbi:MAG: TIM barrel protein [bacterium]